MLYEHDIDVLNSLITTTIDSADGFERAAEDADSGRFASLFRDFAAERRQVVARLQETVRGFGGTPNDDGSLKADLHRRWLDLRAAIGSGGGDEAIVAEVERGEDYLKAKYEAALADGLLTIELVREIPEAMKPRKIAIGDGAGRAIESEAGERQVEKQEEREAREAA